MLAVIKHVDDNIIYNIICLSATQLMHAPAHGAYNIVQQLLRKNYSPFLLSYSPQQAKAGVN